MDDKKTSSKEYEQFISYKMDFNGVCTKTRWIMSNSAHDYLTKGYNLKTCCWD